MAAHHHGPQGSIHHVADDETDGLAGTFGEWARSPHDARDTSCSVGNARRSPVAIGRVFRREQRRRLVGGIAERSVFDDSPSTRCGRGGGHDHAAQRRLRRWVPDRPRQSDDAVSAGRVGRHRITADAVHRRASELGHPLQLRCRGGAVGEYRDRRRLLLRRDVLGLVGFELRRQFDPHGSQRRDARRREGA